MRQIRSQGLFVILLFVCAALITTSCTAGIPTPTPTSIPAEDVYINPPFQEVEPGQEVTVTVEVKPQGCGISGGEIQLSFDSTALMAVDLEAGNLLGVSPLVGLEEIDNETGVLKHSLARVGVAPLPTSPGVLSVIKFKVLETAKAGSYQLNLSQVSLTDEEFKYLADVKTQGASVKVGAEEVAELYILTVEAEPSEGGHIRHSAGGGEGQFRFASGEVVQFMAVAAEGYQFDHWSGDLSGDNDTVRLAMDSDKVVTAHFSPAETIAGTYALRVEADPLEGGYVRPGSGIYDSGEVLTVIAVAAEGYQFDYWSGDLSGRDDTARLVMDDNKWVVAHFSPTETIVGTYALRVEADPLEGGYVRPGSGIYDSGEVLTVIAVAAEGYQFDYWSGDLSGESDTSRLIMDSDKWVVAHFSRIVERYHLSVSVSPSGAGSVSPESSTYESGTVVTLYATPSRGYEFDYWSGDVSGRDPSVRIIMDSDKRVTANFKRG